MKLAGIKIVKSNIGKIFEVGGIPISYTSTGPYRLSAVGHNQMSFVRDRHYWGVHLGSRNGLFNLRRIDISTSRDSKLARIKLSHGKANFYFEPLPRVAQDFWYRLSNYLTDIRMDIEQAPWVQTRKPALVFNFKNPLLQDVRVRRALMLAYDIDEKLRRPLDLADSSGLLLTGLPSKGVAKALNDCKPPVDAFADINSYGHRLFRISGDNRARLVEAQKLLNEAGFSVRNNWLESPRGRLVLRVYAPEMDSEALYLYQSNLARLGIELYIGSKKEDPANFDLYSQPLEFLSKDGRIYVENLKLPETKYTPCLKRLLKAVHNNPPHTSIYQESAEAVVRLTESLQMFILTGQSSVNYFFRDIKMVVPKALPLINAHIYGYEYDTRGMASNWAPPSNFSCADVGCVFGQLITIR
jgi:hypothetical protein